MTGEALRAAQLDLAEFGVVLVRTEWDAVEIRIAAPVVTRARRAGNLWAVEVVSSPTAGTLGAAAGLINHIINPERSD